jgi:hypothetical protein
MPRLAEDAYDLAAKLRQSYLLEWAGEGYRHLSDDIIRRLLILRRKNDAPHGFRAACQQAKQFCQDQLLESSEYGPFWALESLFEFLQAHMQELEDLDRRLDIRHQFFEIELPFVLNLLIQGRDPRSEYVPFKRILTDDWELKFMVNYYLRGETFDRELYRKMEQKVEVFFHNVSGNQHSLGE